ncbi:1681_t:CDS:2 [Ambispora gerdemannii]|uniref:1681_t:CDS:1 n=1 Tax=Ambispora gerdemannii TaxID=144530 RepID=A0A9N9DEG2_9GLOM|nr:1681_t:CDS:2 [Ambispora gerdemannii]
MCCRDEKNSSDVNAFWNRDNTDILRKRKLWKIESSDLDYIHIRDQQLEKQVKLIRDNRIKAQYSEQTQSQSFETNASVMNLSSILNDPEKSYSTIVPNDELTILGSNTLGRFRMSRSNKTDEGRSPSNTRGSNPSIFPAWGNYNYVNIWHEKRVFSKMTCMDYLQLTTTTSSNQSDDVNTCFQQTKTSEDEVAGAVKKKSKLSKVDLKDLFESFVRDTTVKFDIPKDIIEYLHDLLGGDIESALSKVEKSLDKDARPLFLWTREVCRHFIFYYYYGGLQIKGDEKTWSAQTVYRILDLFSMFFGELTSGIAFGEIVNEAHKDRIYNINVDQKPANSNRGNKNDAVLYQDENATIIYEQTYGPTEFDLAHYLGDLTKLARNGVDDLNYYFNQYPNSSITTAKKFKSVGIHGYKYLISIYLTDLIRKKTYRVYEIFNCKIPTTYADRWLLVKIANIGVYFEALLKERQFVKGELGKEDTINENGSCCVQDWISIPDNTPEKGTKRD